MLTLAVGLSGFELPRNIAFDNQYEATLKQELDRYIDHIEEKKHHEYNKDKLETFEDVLCSVKEDTALICKSIELYYSGNFSRAKECIKDIIEKYVDDEFIVSPISKSYAFKGMCNFPELMSHFKDSPEQQVLYAEQREYPVYLFKARDSNQKIEIKDMLHIPFEKRSLVSTQRFSMPGIPCVYLSTTSLGCWLELNMSEQKTFWVSAFDITNINFKVLNLCVGQHQINGACIMNNNQKEFQFAIQLMKIFPLVYATSFTVSEKNRNFKSEYIISQLLMQAIKELKIDAISYNSKKVEDMYAYPQCVNLAIPAAQVPNEKYSDIGEMIKLTKPILYEAFLESVSSEYKAENKSYINKFYNKDKHDYLNIPEIGIRYSETRFSQFDDFLIGQERLDFRMHV